MKKIDITHELQKLNKSVWVDKFIADFFMFFYANGKGDAVNRLARLSPRDACCEFYEWLKDHNMIKLPKRPKNG